MALWMTNWLCFYISSSSMKIQYKNYTRYQFPRHLVAGSEDIFFQRYGRYGITKIWMDDILPCRAYLRHWWVLQLHLPNSSMHETFPSIDNWFLEWSHCHCHQISWQILKIFCSVLAAKNLSDVAYDNFLDHTFLGDRRTTIREYLANSGSGIMEEEPPEDLKHRYGGWYELVATPECGHLLTGINILIQPIWVRTRLQIA